LKKENRKQKPDSRNKCKKEYNFQPDGYAADDLQLPIFWFLLLHYTPGYQHKVCRRGKEERNLV
jgi:hypothetical protein